jgi:Holliday junction resolvase RusA-like endonuclease
LRTVIHLPFPPSVNHLFAGGKNGGRFTSKRYKEWQDMAYIMLLSQPARMNRHTEPVQVTYLFTPPDKRLRDVLNLEKAASDLLVKHLVLADDSLIHRGIIEWYPHEHAATIIIEPFEPRTK